MVDPSRRAVRIRPQLYPPLGLAYLAAALIERGHEAIIIDANAGGETPDEIATRFKLYNPSLIGIYCNSFNLRQVKAIIAALRRLNVAHIVLGGPHVTCRPQALPALGADYAIRGDGEESLIKLVEALEARKAPDGIPGFVSVENGGVRAEEAAAVRDLDSLPFPARRLLPEERYYSPAKGGKMTTLVTVRGCTSRCIFCAMPRQVYRARTVENVLLEFEGLAEEGYEYVDIHDPTFTMDKNRTHAILNGLVERRINILWGCETRADRVDADLVDLMKRAGCDNIRFGIEAGSSRVRNEIVKKNLEADDIHLAFRLCREADIDTMAFFMLGHPTETMDEIKETLGFARELSPTYADFSIAIPIPGSELFDLNVEDGLIEESVWEDVIDGAPVPLSIPDGIPVETLSRLRRKAYRNQYLSYRQILHQLRRVRGFRDLVNKLRAAASILAASQRRKPVIW